MLLVLQELLKEEFQQEAEGEDNPVPARIKEEGVTKQVVFYSCDTLLLSTKLPSKEGTTQYQYKK